MLYCNPPPGRGARAAPFNGTGGRTRVPAKHYRRQLEMLRDFLGAARTEIRKTPLMNRANLNRTSFSHYLNYCIENQLLMTTNGGFVTTPRAEELLQRLDQVLAKEADFRIAVEGLKQVTRSGAYKTARTDLTPEALARIAFPSLGIEFLSTRWRDRDRGRDRERP
jgi:predicted transcriptional regulator